MNDLELKRQNIEKLVKVVAVCVAGFFFAPIAFLTIKGIVSLVVVGALALLTVNIAIPWLAASLANWRLKALKSVAAENPIETLEVQYGERETALIKIRENIKEFHTVVAELWNQIQDHNERYPDRPSQFVEKYNKMKALLTLRGNKYKQAQANLKQFGELIEEKRSDWKVAQSAAKAMKLANVGEDFQSKLMQDTALNTIQDGLNMAFSELEVSLLDEQPLPVQATQVIVANTDSPKAARQLAEKSGPPVLDLEFEDGDHEKVTVASRRQTV